MNWYILVHFDSVRIGIYCRYQVHISLNFELGCSEQCSMKHRRCIRHMYTAVSEQCIRQLLCKQMPINDFQASAANCQYPVFECVLMLPTAAVARSARAHTLKCCQHSHSCLAIAASADQPALLPLPSHHHCYCCCCCCHLAPACCNNTSIFSSELGISVQSERKCIVM